MDDGDECSSHLGKETRGSCIQFDMNNKLSLQWNDGSDIVENFLLFLKDTVIAVLG